MPPPDVVAYPPKQIDNAAHLFDGALFPSRPVIILLLSHTAAAIPGARSRGKISVNTAH